MKPLKENNGFTLIEIIVVTILIITLSSIGLAAYNSLHQRQVLQQAANEVKSALRDAQNRALAGEKIYPFCENKTLDYWQFISLDTDYQINISCGGETMLIKSFSLPSGLNFIGFGDIINFKPLTYGIDNPAGIDIIQNSTHSEVNIDITSSGEITETYFW